MFFPVNLPTVRFLSGEGPNCRCIGTRFGFGEGDGEDTFSTDRGKKPAFNLLRSALEKDVIYVSEGPADKDISGVAELFLGQNPVQGVQTCAPESFGDIHCEEPEFQGFVLDFLGQIRVQHAASFDFLFQRFQFLADELLYGFHQHLLFMGEGKIHQ